MNTEQLRELDAFCAEHVMGWRLFEDGRGNKKAMANGRTDREREYTIEAKHPWDCPDFNPTTDPAAALMVLERCIHSDDVVLYKTVQEKYGIRSDITDLAIDAETLPLAICLFAQKLFSTK